MTKARKKVARGVRVEAQNKTETSGVVHTKQKELGVWGHFGFRDVILKDTCGRVPSWVVVMRRVME